MDADGPAARGIDADPVGPDRLPFATGWISPLALVTLFVKDEMAQPAQDVSLGVPIRAVTALEGGGAVSVRLLPYLRMRCKYRSSVLLA